MHMKVALVTGGGSGIGRETALLFSERGAAVVIADASLNGAEQVCDEIRSSGGRAVAVQADVRVEAAVEAMVACAEQTFGGLDYGVNNAGILGPSGVPLDDLPLTDWSNTIAVNLTGVMLSLKHELRAVRRRGGGAIVNVSSAAGLIATPLNPAYCASKHGVLGLTKAAAVAYATEKIRINAVCPGPVETELLAEMQRRREVSSSSLVAPVPLARKASAREIAECIVWLCSDASSYVVGHALSVDGGWVAL